MKISSLKLRITVVFLSAILLLVSVFPVFASEVSDLENTTSELENELSGLNNELAVLGAEIDSITEQIQTTAQKLEETKASLAIAKGEEIARYETMTLRIKYMYENGNISLLEMLFSATCMADFLNRAEFYASIVEYDQRVLAEMEQARQEIEAKEKQLEEDQIYLNELQAELDAKEQALYSQISATSSELAEYETKLAVAREEARKAEEALAAEIEPVIPESPIVDDLETEEDEDNDVSIEDTASDDDSSADASDDTSNDSSDDSSSEQTDGSGSEIVENDPVESTASDVELLAALLECEAGTSDYEALLAVGSVVVNRMNSRYYPDTLRGVIFQSGQFPPALSGKVDRIVERGVNSLCVQAAQDALNGKNNVGDCLSFRSASSGHAGTVIGGNVFF